MIVKKNFGGSDVTFEPALMNQNVMVNATQMAKVFGKRPVEFLRNDQTQKFIEAFCQSENLHFGDEFSPKGQVVKIQKGDPSVSGTWMTRILALKFAAWLSPEFEIWVFKTIEEIMFGYSREQDKSIQRTVELQQQMKAIEGKMERSGKDFDEYMKLQKQITHERSLRASVTKNRFREFYKLMVTDKKQLKS
ncbi:MAG: KilA-N domain-containing protein [Marinifilum sp.]|jgi:hypothetical protein|nr:KilA-N domain-containing protein [Marinifilum sp.]